MVLSIASAEADKMLDAYLNHVDYPGNTAVYMKLHVGLPGPSGTANPASETTRKALVCSTPSGGIITNTSALDWLGVTVSGSPETYTHFSLWTASTAGTFLGNGLISASGAISNGENFSIDVGEFVGAMSVAT